MAEHGQQEHSAIPGTTQFPTVAQTAHISDSPAPSAKPVHLISSGFMMCFQYIYPQKAC